MSKATNAGKSTTPPTHRKRQVNLKALAILAALLVCALPGLIGLKMLQERRSGTSYLKEGLTRIDKGDLALGLGYLNRYLELNPDDLQALDRKAEVLARTAKNHEEIQEAIKLHTRVLGRQDKAHPLPDGLATQRRLVKLLLSLPDAALQGAAARSQAESLVAALRGRGAVDAEALHFYASALVRAADEERNPETAGKILDQACEQYLEAETLEPGDIAGAEALARLYRDKLEKPAEAVQVLDGLVALTDPTKLTDPADKSRAKTPTAGDHKKYALALLARAAYFKESRPSDPVKARKDLEVAHREDPGNIEVMIALADVAVDRRELANARQFLRDITAARGALTAAGRKLPFELDKQMRLIEGRIDLAEQNPEAAVRTWRAGLVEASGNDMYLTYRLAELLLELNRVDEAREQIRQFKRLATDPELAVLSKYLDGLLALKTSQIGEKDGAISLFEDIRYKATGKYSSLGPRVEYLLGQAYQANGQTAKALEAYLQAADRSTEPDWTQPWLAAADLQARTSLTQAADILERGLASQPGKHHPVIDAALARVRWIEQLRKPETDRDWAAIETIMQKAEKDAPGSPELALFHADYYLSVKRLDDALAQLESACTLHPQSAALWLRRAEILFQTRKYGRALEVLDEAVVKARPEAQFYVSRSLILRAKGDNTRAKETLKDGLKRCPVGQKPLLWKALGELYTALNDPNSAAAAYQEWERTAPFDPQPKYALLNLAVTSNDDAAFDRAVEAMSKVPAVKRFYENYAKVRRLVRDRPGGVKPDNAKIEEAAKYAGLIVKDEPELAFGHQLLGLIEERLGHTDAAVDAYRKALKLKGGDDALGPLVTLLVREKRDNDLKQLRVEFVDKPGAVDRLEADAALRLGYKDRAEQLAGEASRGGGLDVRVWQAEVLGALGKPEEAIQKLEALIQEKSDDPVLWLRLLMLHVSRKKTAEAMATIERMKGAVKTDYPDLLWAQCYRAAGDAAEARKAYMEALRKWPAEPAVLQSAVAFFRQSGLVDDAEAVLQGVRAADPSNGWARRQLAECLATGHPGDLTKWKEAVALVGPQPDDVTDDVLTRARVYAQGPAPEDRQKALALFEGLLREQPGFTAAHGQLARLLVALGRSAEARGHAEIAATGENPDADTVLLYAAVLLDLKEVDKAEEQLARLVKVDPDGLPVAELRAKVLAARGQPAQAAEVLEKAFSGRAGTPEALYVGENMVALLTRLGQPAAAERVGRRIAETGSRGRLVLARVLAGEGKLDEAAAELEKIASAGTPEDAGGAALALALAPKADPRWIALADRCLADAAKAKPGSFSVLDKTALLRHVQGRFQDEVATYNAMLAVNAPGPPLFLNNMAWTLSEEMNDPKEGLRRIDEAIKKVGPQPALLDTRGVINQRLGKYEEAVRDLETAAGQVPDNASFYYHLARAYRKWGKPEQANKYRDLALKAKLDRGQLQGSEQADWDAVMGK